MPPRPAPFRFLLLVLIACVLAACGSAPSRAPKSYFTLPAGQQHELVLYAIGLLDTKYVFGGRNPEAGLDCSGMVSYIVEQVSGKRLPHNAAQIAHITRPIKLKEAVPGDLLFFNTSGRAHSHMGIYIGDNRFIHAPSSRGQVRKESLKLDYFRKRLDGVRTLRPR
ncbi:MAG: C40 family peptidase [Rhodocyclaceae bacterium]|nr:C40 family peptidase [Rhodocyclaceae bacterium]